MKRLYLVFIVLVIYSCEKSQKVKVSDEFSLMSNNAVSERMLCPTSDTLTVEDAIILSELYQKKCSVLTKSNQKMISNVVPINGNNQSPLMYAINYQGGGYLLVSATKKYYPIIASVEKGSFSYDENNPSSLLINDYLFDLEQANCREGYNSVLHSIWSQYEYSNVIERGYAKTKSGEEIWDEYYDLLYDNYYWDWINAGYNVYFLHNPPLDMPEDVYEDFCIIAEDDEDLESLGLDYRYTSIITERLVQNNTTVGPLIHTKWGQSSPWNGLVPSNNLLGCVTVATGQIMRYHTKPASFSWSDMPVDTCNTTIQSFLANLKNNLLVYNGGSSIYISNVLLGLYGYSTTIINHSVSQVVSSLASGNPVYMRGFDAARGNVGHAWICDGYNSMSSWVEYRLYLLQTDYGHPDRMVLFDDETCNFSSYVSLHMNWGLDGDYDGFYGDTGISFNDNGTIKNYSSDRKDMIVVP